MRPQYTLGCSRCSVEAQEGALGYQCPECGGYYEYVFDPGYLRGLEFRGPMTFWRYRPVIPRVEKPVSLGEGGTPYWRAERLGEHIGFGNLALKDETRNPTSSFKDRSAALIVSDAVGKGFDSLVCATNGNHGASLAAYSAKEDISCRLIVPENLDLGKLAQMIAYDARVEEAGGAIEAALEKALEIAEETGVYQATTELNPLSVEAMKTIAYEINEQAGVPDWVAVAMGSGVTLHSIWKGFKELEISGAIDETPRLIGVQAEGCSPIATAFQEKRDELSEPRPGETVATAIRVTEPLYGDAALKALKESGGLTVTVTDDSMVEFGKEIARHEGIFAEPASAASVACLPVLLNDGTLDSQDSVVSIVTSSGLKTNDIIKSLNHRRKSPGLTRRLATKERILRLITREESYGYAIWKSLGKEMTLGAVYQHLSDLEGRGLLTSHVEGKRRYLRVTEKGRRVLEALDELQVLL